MKTKRMTGENIGILTNDIFCPKFAIFNEYDTTFGMPSKMKPSYWQAILRRSVAHNAYVKVVQ
ncbi:MAG: hypothetical protein IPH74_16115 [Bacteroidetes bacterium]|nr:hypothetical protein [Bacteroidota bacterium]